MTDALIVLNPRRIPECIAAIEQLDIDTCWLSYMPEPAAAGWANHVIANTGYDRYTVLSDDTLPTQDALDRVLRLQDRGHPVVTGYCNLDTATYRDIVNLTSNVLPPPPPKVRSYQLMSRGQAEQQGEVIDTTFAGLALTCMTRDLWLEHPLQTSEAGNAMDYMLSYSLAQAGVPIVAANGAYVHHVKERWNFPDHNPEKRLLVGHRTPKVTWVAATPGRAEFIGGPLDGLQYTPER